MEKCWLCPQKFSSKTDLYGHVISKEHRRQSVFCPWCAKEKTFTRVTDLNKHCMSRHFIEVNVMPKSFLGMRNCFYLSVFPEDYAKIIKPEPWDSTVAIEARRLMITWAEKQENSLIRRDNFRRGWRAGLKVRESDVENKENTKKQKVNKETTVSNTHEIFTATPLKLNTEINVNKQIKQTHEQCNTPKASINEKATKPIVAVSRLSDSDTDLEDETEGKRDKTGCAVKLVKENGMRRLRVEEENDKEKQQGKEKSSGNDKNERAEIVKEKQVNSIEKKRDIEYETQGNKTEETHVTTEVKQKQVKSIDKPRDIEYETLENKLEAAQSEITEVKQMQAKTEKEVPTKHENTEVGHVTMKQNEDKKVDNNEQSKTNHLEDNTNKKTSNKKTDNYDYTDVFALMKKAKEESKKYQTKENESIEKEKRGINLVQRTDGSWRRVLEIPKRLETKEAMNTMSLNKDSTQNEGQELQHCSSKQISLEKETEEAVNNITQCENHQEKQNTNSKINSHDVYQDKARMLLREGVMPLCPPARREWHGVPSISIHVKGTSIQWPPNDWEQMSADRRLLAAEYTAMLLETAVNGFVSPTTTRKYLMDKFNFLILPGSAKVHGEELEKASSRIRYYNYQLLREVATGRTPSKAEEDHINMLEYIQSSQISSDIDMSKINVPLRLEK